MTTETENHCHDCCCAQSWKALGVTEYTGKSIPEHIEQLRSQNAQLREEFRVTAVRCFNIGCLHGHEDTAEGRFVVILPQDLDSFNSELIDEMLRDGSLPEAKQALAATPAPERVEKIH